MIITVWFTDIWVILYTKKVFTKFHIVLLL